MKSTHKKPIDLIHRGAAVCDAIESIDASLDPALRHRQLRGCVHDAATKTEAANQARAAYLAAVQVRDDSLTELRGRLTRVHAGVLAAFGPDSAEYASLGLVRRSQRKRAGTKKPRKPAAAAASTPGPAVSNGSSAIVATPPVSITVTPTNGAGH